MDVLAVWYVFAYVLMDGCKSVAQIIFTISHSSIPLRHCAESRMVLSVPEMLCFMGGGQRQGIK